MPNQSSRQAKADRRSQAKFRDLLARYSDSPAPSLPLAGPGGRPTIADSDVLGAPRVVLVKCGPCGSGVRGVRALEDGRFVLGSPWVEILADGKGVFPTKCNNCGATGAVREALLVSTAIDAKSAGKAVTMRVGQSPAK